MIRVLHVISAPAAGGAETFVRDLAIAQKAAGALPHIAFLERAANGGRDPAFERDYLRSLEEAGIAYHFIGHECRRNPLLGMIRVARTCREHAITHYHAHLLTGLLFGAFLRIPRLFTEHSGTIRGAPLVRRLCNAFVEQYIAISRTCATALESVVHKVPVVIMNAIDLSRIDRDAAPSRRTVPKLLSVGRISEPKNYPLLIEALAELEPRGVDYSLDLAGDGSPDAISSLRALAEARGVDHRIRFLGNRSDIAVLMAQSDLLVMSSRREGLPIVLIEAVASGLPFVSTDVGGCREIAAMTGAGIVVEPGDARALAEAIHTLLANPSQRDAMRAAAVANATRFSIEAAARAHLDLYASTGR